MSSLFFLSPVALAILVGIVAQREKGRIGALYWLVTVILAYLLGIFIIPDDETMIALGRGPIGVSYEQRFLYAGVLATILMLIIVATLPRRLRKSDDRTTVDEDGFLAPAKRTRDCPHCAEEILAAAKVCKHCGRDVAQDLAAQ